MTDAFLGLHLADQTSMSGRRIPLDHLFRGLDGRRLRVGGDHWRVEVYGVFEEPERRWVQVALVDGAYPRVLTLRLAPTHGPGHAVRSLTSWLANPSAVADVRAHVA